MNQAGLRKLPVDLRLLTVCVATALQILWLLPRAEAQASWSTGQYLYAGSGRPTSGTLALELGPRPGNYSIWGSDTDVRLNVFLPDQARNYPMQAVAVDGQHTVIAGQEAEMDAVAVSPDTILVDFKAKGELSGLAMIDVKVSAQDTTTTMTPLGNGLTVEAAGSPVHFQAVGTKVMRLRTVDGFQIVVPLAEDKPVRLIISQKAYSPQEIRALMPRGGESSARLTP